MHGTVRAPLFHAAGRILRPADPTPRRTYRTRRISSAQRSGVGRMVSLFAGGGSRRPARYRCRDSGQSVGVLGGAKEGDRHGLGVGSSLRQHPTKPRQELDDITIGPAAGNRSPAVAVADRAPPHAARRRRRGPAGVASGPASATPSFPENRPFRRGTRPLSWSKSPSPRCARTHQPEPRAELGPVIGHFLRIPAAADAE